LKTQKKDDLLIDDSVQDNDSDI